MELRPFQSEALTRIIDAFNSGLKSALLIMPAGTGKTVLSGFIFKEFAVTNASHSMAFIADTKIMQSQFNSLVAESSDLPENIVKAYTYWELGSLIDKNEIKSDEFQVLIFDNINDHDQLLIEKIYHYFSGFKIGFSRRNLNEFKSIFQVQDGGIIFLYSLDQAVSDGYFLSSQRALYRHFFYNLKHQIADIRVGSDWTQTLQQNLIQQIDFVTAENAEYLKALELILSGKINTAEIIELSHRKEQLEEFNKLLNDVDYFDERVQEVQGVEAVWQAYFESNPWIFGFGLNYIFNAPLDGKKLEQTVAGYSITGNGKRTDALLKTTGLIQTLCFGEIKTHRKSILKEVKTPYRSESWAISEELAGGIAQIQTTIQKSLKNISTALSIYDDDGFKFGDPVYLFKPKAFLLIGSLKEFKNEMGNIHEDKFSSFELFRRSISDIEIITFDELYERANAIVNKKWNYQ